MEECLFCKIIRKEIPVKIDYEDSQVVVFPDIKPLSRVHLLVVPTVHVNSFLDIQDSQISMLTNLAKVIQTLIKDKKLESSYRLVFNGGKRQHIPHLHWHLLGD